VLGYFGRQLAISMLVTSGAYDVYVGIPYNSGYNGMGIALVPWFNATTPPLGRTKDLETGIYYSAATGISKNMTFVGCVYINANVTYDFYGARCVLNMYNRMQKTLYCGFPATNSVTYSNTTMSYITTTTTGQTTLTAFSGMGTNHAITLYDSIINNSIATLNATMFGGYAAAGAAKSFAVGVL
jgi:hypothetical protein